MAIHQGWHPVPGTCRDGFCKVRERDPQAQSASTSRHRSGGHLRTGLRGIRDRAEGRPAWWVRPSEERGHAGMVGWDRI